MEKTVEIKSCKNCGAEFEITDKDLEFYDKVSPVFGERKYGIPSPTHCPDCRQQRRLAWRNERKLYRRTCDATGKPLISNYSVDKDSKVYNVSYWWSDSWDPMQYGKDFDYNRSFFEQFNELNKAVPSFSLFIDPSSIVNSEFANEGGHLKNSYLVFNGDFLEDCLYDNDCHRCVNTVDCAHCSDCQECYESLDLSNCFKVTHSLNCLNCSNSSYLIDCEGCNFCYASQNLVNKEYCIANKQYTKEEYMSIISQPTILKNLLGTTDKSSIVKSYRGYSNENATGDGIYKSKDIKASFMIEGAENVAYSDKIWKSRNLYDIYAFGNEIELSMEGVSIGENAFNILFCYGVAINVSKVMYSKCCFFSSNLFGCIGLKNKSYCIFNKQYTKEEYEALVPRIIEHMQKTGEWGEFFPAQFSPFGYNESMAMEYHPLSMTDARSKGYKWMDQEYPINIPDSIEKVSAQNLSLNIADYDDDILNKAILCEVTGKPYRIVKAELDFYRKHKLPLPKRHPDQRHLDRLAKRNPRKLRERSCQCSNCAGNNNTDKPIVFKTTYSPDRPEKVYCEVCYNKEVYG